MGSEMCIRDRVSGVRVGVAHDKYEELQEVGEVIIVADVDL